jgi:hypothetical protein
MLDTDDFDLLRPDVFSKLRDEKWFRIAISLEYRRIARRFRCVPIMSDERLIQAHDLFWDDADIGRMKNLPPDTSSLDQFKLSSYLAFWLRRINPTSRITPMLSLDQQRAWANSDQRLLANAERFLLYGNEVCAISIAIKLAQYLNLVVMAHKSKLNIANKNTPIILFSMSMINTETLIEYAKIWKHKNISAQGINMALQMFCGVGIETVVLDKPVTLGAD